MRIKTIFTLIILSIFINKINSQTTTPAATPAVIAPVNKLNNLQTNELNYEFGLRIAPQLSWSSPDSKTLSNGGSSLDWNYGFHVAKKITPRYSIAFEVNVINMTSKIKVADSINIFSDKTPAGSPTTDMAINYSLRYLQIPIIFKMTTDPFKEKWRIFGEFGMGFSFLVRSKADISSSVLKLDNVDVDNPDNPDKFYINQNSTNDNYKIKVNFFRPSFIIGGGVLHDLFGQTKAYAGLRYDGGLVDYMGADKWNAYNSFTALNLGIIF